MEQREICQEGVEYILKHRDDNLEVGEQLNTESELTQVVAPNLLLYCGSRNNNLDLQQSYQS